MTERDRARWGLLRGVAFLVGVCFLLPLVLFEQVAAAVATGASWPLG